MLQLQLSLIQDELHNDARDESQSDSRHESEVEGARRRLLVLEPLVDRERLADDVELEISLTSGRPQKRSVEVLGVEGRHVLRGHIQVRADLVQVSALVGPVDLERAIAVWERLTVLASLVERVVELGVAQVVFVHDLESVSSVRQLGCELMAQHI